MSHFTRRLITTNHKIQETQFSMYHSAMKFVGTLLYVGTALMIGQAEGVTEFPCTFPEEWRGNEFSVYRGSPPILSSIWYFEDNGVEFEADGDPGFCYQITDQFYIIRYTIHGQDTFKCLTIDYTPGGKRFTIGNKGNPQTVNQMQPGAFDETAMCSLCAKLTNEFQLAIENPVPTEPTEIVPPKCDVPYFCTPETGTICESPITTTKAPITTTTTTKATITPKKKKSCARRRKHP